MNSILTVCIGNICRSPMAEALLAQAMPNMAVSSAGTGALVGYPADDSAQRLMADRGLDISGHRARQVTRDMCQRADLILVMDDGQKRQLLSQYPVVRGKVFRLNEFDKLDVPDPYRQDFAAFEYALDLINRGVAAWRTRIEKI